MATAEKKSVLTPRFRASYEQIWKPKWNEKTGKLVYAVTGIFEPDADFTEMKAIAKAARIAKFGEVMPPKFKSPFRPGTAEEFDLEKNPAYAGNTIIPFRSYDMQPGVMNRRKELIHDDYNELYSGCYCVAKVNAYAYDVDGNKGVSFGLQSLIVVAMGEPLVARSNPERDFADVNVADYGGDEDLFEEVDSGLDDI